MSSQNFPQIRISNFDSSSIATVYLYMARTEGMNKDYFIINYLDDFSVIVPERYYYKCVDCLLKKMANENLIVALQKSDFFKTECKFLGFLITESGIKAEDMKVKALLELDFPRNLKEGQRFQGALNYYSRLIPNMSACLKPLSEEIGKGKAFTLNDEIIEGIKLLCAEINKGV